MLSAARYQRHGCDARAEFRRTPTVNISELADMAEVFTIIGVIVSSLFVAYQVRQITNEIERIPREASKGHISATWSRTSSADTRELRPVMMRAMEQALSAAD